MVNTVLSKEELDLITKLLGNYIDCDDLTEELDEEELNTAEHLYLSCKKLGGGGLQARWEKPDRKEDE